MMRLILALFALALTTSADAQQRTGTRIGGTPARVRSEDTEAARMTLYEYVVARFRTRSMRVSRVLAMSASSPEYVAGLRALTVHECLSSGRMRMPELVHARRIVRSIANFALWGLSANGLSAVPEMD